MYTRLYICTFTSVKSLILQIGFATYHPSLHRYVGLARVRGVTQAWEPISETRTLKVCVLIWNKTIETTSYTACYCIVGPPADCFIPRM